jgi:hypothetical protein
VDPKDRMKPPGPGSAGVPVRPSGPTGPRLPVDGETLGEMLAYAGGIVALTAAGIRFIARGDLSEPTLVTFLALSAGALLAFGWIGGDREDERRRRLRGVFWLLALVALVELITFITVSVAKFGGRPEALWPTFVGALIALGLWLLTRGSLQQIGLGVLVAASLIALTFPRTDLLVPFSRPDFTATALTLFVMGVAWLALGAYGILTPKRTACAMGAALAAFSPYLLVVNHGTVAAVSVGIVGLLLIPAGEAIGVRAVSGIGIAGLLVGGGVATQRLVGGSAASAWTALILGLAALGVAMSLLRRARPVVPPPPPPAAALDGPGAAPVPGGPAPSRAAPPPPTPRPPAEPPGSPSSV